MTDRAYFDNNATTPLDPLVTSAITRALTLWANPSSSNDNALRATKAIQKSRDDIAKMLNADSTMVIFTSGGTESNNWVIDSSIKKYLQKCPSTKPHVIASTVEHPSISLPLQKRHDDGIIDVTWVDVDPETGAVRPEDVAAQILPNTCLITIMLANNETGVIQPIEMISKAIRTKSDAYIHTDAAQAIGKIDVDIKKLGVDALTVVGHKFYGPRIGALVFRSPESALEPLLLGGGQESGYRSGTENVPMIVGLGEAARVVTENAKKIREDLRRKRDRFEHDLEKRLGARLRINFQSSSRLPNTSSAAFLSCPTHGCDLVANCQSFYASTGAACHKNMISPVLKACGIPFEIASKTLRISFGRFNNEEEIDVAVDELVNLVSD